MKAAIFHAANHPLAVEEIPTPTPGAGEVLVKVAGCGVCHTDLHIWDGDLTQPKLPLILGQKQTQIVCGTRVGGESEISPDE